ncbi:MAG: hypothetical protein R2831_13415 [Chitinophagaceae bacterium]
MRSILFILIAIALMATTALAGNDAVPPISNSIKWATASEVDNFGFDVYRSDNEDGPFERINESVIAGAGTSDTPNRYEYVDTAIAPETVYWYYVESISVSGKRKQFTPTLKSKPRSLPADEATPSTD